MDTLPPLQRGKGIFVNLTLDGICRLHLSGGHAKILLRIYEEAARWGDKDRSAAPKKAGNAMEKRQKTSLTMCLVAIGIVFDIIGVAVTACPEAPFHAMASRKVAEAPDALFSTSLEIEADGERFDLRSLMVLIFNGETAGGFHLARRSSIKDGLFDCILLEKKNFFRSTLAMCRYLAGGSPKIVRHLRARRIDIRSSVNEPTDVDGQKGAEFPLHIECLAGGLRVMCAKQASGNS